MPEYTKEELAHMIRDFMHTADRYEVSVVGIKDDKAIFDITTVVNFDQLSRIMVVIRESKPT